MRSIPIFRCGDIIDSAIVDNDDYDLANSHIWRLSDSGYAMHQTANSGKRAYVWLHKLILPTEGQVDHINRDKLDCRKENLRPATNALNAQNVDGRGSSGFRGVYFDKRKKSKPWMASCMVNGIVNYLGMYATAQEAHQIVVRFRAENMPFSEDALAIGTKL